MNKIELTDEILKSAAGYAHEKWMNANTASSEESHDFPLGFYDKILRKAQKRKQIKTITRHIAAAIITIIICGAVLLASSPKVRALKRGRFLEIFYNIEYRLSPDGDSSKLPEFELSYIPEGFKEINVLNERDRISEYYLNTETGDSFLFEYMQRTDDKDITFHTEMTSAYESIIIGDYEAYFYLTDDTFDKNNIVWFDESQNLYFTVSSNLEKSVILNIAEGVSLVDS